MGVPKHPAKFNDRIVETMAGFIKENEVVYDPFYGKGGADKFLEYQPTIHLYGTEIQPLWCFQGDWGIVADVACFASLHAAIGEFPKADVIASSPVYLNRMLDAFKIGPQNKGSYHTYTHYYGQELEPQNMGHMKNSQQYMSTARVCVRNMLYFLKMGGRVVWDTKPSLRTQSARTKLKPHEYMVEEKSGGKVLVKVDTPGIWRELFLDYGLEHIGHVDVESPGMRHGQNADVRYDQEVIDIYLKPAC